jgi:ATP-dependent Clp protease protease subunit
MGMAASGAAIILAAGTKGRRYALPNSKIMIHQPWGQVGYGQVSDLEIEAKEMLKDRARLDEILAKHTGQPLDKIAMDTERDYFMSGEEAKKYGLIDEVITRPPKMIKDLVKESKDGGKEK